MESGAQRLADAITEFIFVEDTPEQSDLIVIPGSMSPWHAERAAQLYLLGFAPLILPSGRFSIGSGRTAPLSPDAARKYPGSWPTEWAFLKHVLVENGVPEEAILKEDQATFTWENALFSRRVTDGLGLTVRQALLCCKPWHARRALTYYQAAYPQTRFLVCPDTVSHIRRETWYRTPEGRKRVYGEVARMGDQITEELEMLLGEPEG